MKNTGRETTFIESCQNQENANENWHDGIDLVGRLLEKNNQMNLSEKEIAEKSEVPLETVKQFFADVDGISFGSVIRIARTLEMKLTLSTI